MHVKTIEIDPRDLPACLSTVRENRTVASVEGMTSTTARPTRREMLGGMLAAFAGGGVGKADAIPADLSVAFLNFGEKTEIHVLPPGRHAPPLLEGAWRSRLALGGGWDCWLSTLSRSANLSICPGEAWQGMGANGPVVSIRPPPIRVMIMPTSMERRIPVRNGFVVLNEMADRLGKERSAFRRAVLKAGFIPAKRRLDSTGGQSVNVLTREEAERFIADRRAESLDSGPIEFLAE